ncbi:DUF4176 domain-containing protein [Streptococcus equi]|uniref:DUF4176 domain-containing protein n=1 Tax=Streptococcus equi TaxID=1336 RepID=UPI001E37C177|nr:DUF4176 domain-containing protein [Streptococcus equi]
MSIFFFNHEDIADVIYFGYVNSNEQLFAEAYDDLVKTSGYRKIKLRSSSIEQESEDYLKKERANEY